MPFAYFPQSCFPLYLVSPTVPYFFFVDSLVMFKLLVLSTVPYPRMVLDDVPTLVKLHRAPFEVHALPYNVYSSHTNPRRQRQRHCNRKRSRISNVSMNLREQSPDNTSGFPFNNRLSFTKWSYGVPLMGPQPLHYNRGPNIPLIILITGNRCGPRTAWRKIVAVSSSNKGSIDRKTPFTGSIERFTKMFG